VRPETDLAVLLPSLLNDSDLQLGARSFAKLLVPTDEATRVIAARLHDVVAQGGSPSRASGDRWPSCAGPWHDREPGFSPPVDRWAGRVAGLLPSSGPHPPPAVHVRRPGQGRRPLVRCTRHLGQHPCIWY
jgi:hypothetical protein